MGVELGHPKRGRPHSPCYRRKEPRGRPTPQFTRSSSSSGASGDGGSMRVFAPLGFVAKRGLKGLTAPSALPNFFHTEHLGVEPKASPQPVAKGGPMPAAPALAGVERSHRSCAPCWVRRRRLRRRDRLLERRNAKEDTRGEWTLHTLPSPKDSVEPGL